MQGLIAIVVGQIERLWADLMGLRAQLRHHSGQLRKLRSDVDQLLPGAHMSASGVSPSDLVCLRVTGGEPDEDGLWAAERVVLNATGNESVADDEDTDEYLVRAGPGGECFPGCRGWCVAAAILDEDPPRTVWNMVGGEAFGMKAQITAAPTDDEEDGTRWYPWEQVGWAAPHGSTGSSGMALLVGSLTHDENITERKVLPTGTQIIVHYDIENERWWFTGTNDPVAQEC